MKNMIARAVVVGALLAAGTANAQYFETYRPKESIYLFSYEVATPLGSFSDKFISDTSWRGFGFEGRSMVREGLSVGLGFDFNRYSQEYSLKTATSGTTTISGPLYNYADQFAMKLLVHGYLTKGALRPYVGAGIGGVWTYSFSETADLAKSDNGFDFVISPEVGLLWTAAQGATGAGANLAVRYTYTTASFQEVKDAQSLQVILGIFTSY